MNGEHYLSVWEEGRPTISHLLIIAHLPQHPVTTFYQALSGFFYRVLHFVIFITVIQSDTLGARLRTPSLSFALKRWVLRKEVPVANGDEPPGPFMGVSATMTRSTVVSN